MTSRRGFGAARFESHLVCSRRVRATATFAVADGHVPATGSVAEFFGLLTELSPQQRACAVLRYVGGYTAPEIGELLGTSAGTVRVQLNRAHASLRDSIREAEHA